MTEAGLYVEGPKLAAQELVYQKDPLSTGWQRFMAGFIGVLPVENQQ